MCEEIKRIHYEYKVGQKGINCKIERWEREGS